METLYLRIPPYITDIAMIWTTLYYKIVYITNDSIVRTLFSVDYIKETLFVAASNLGVRITEVPLLQEPNIEKISTNINKLYCGFTSNVQNTIHYI